MPKTKKFRLPKGALQPKYWNIEPERDAAFYTFQSQRYFQSCMRDHCPEVYDYFQTIVAILETEAEDSKYTGWKALADTWCKFLNALVFHDEERFHYHLEANEFISSLEPCNFGAYHRALNIAAFQMDHSTFKESLDVWKTLRKEQSEDFKYFCTPIGDWEWATTTKLVDSHTRETIAVVDDSYWLQLKPKPSRDQVAMISIPMLTNTSHNR
jgi:hypothetical protein